MGKDTLVHFTKEKKYKQPITLAGNNFFLHEDLYSVIITFELPLSYLWEMPPLNDKLSV